MSGSFAVASTGGVTASVPHYAIHPVPGTAFLPADVVQELRDPADRLLQVPDRGQGHQPEVVGGDPVEGAAVGDEDLLLLEQVQGELLVVVEVEDLAVQFREEVHRPAGLLDGYALDVVEHPVGGVALFLEPA